MSQHEDGHMWWGQRGSAQGSPQAEQCCWHLSASLMVGTPLSPSTLPLICPLNQKQHIDWPLWEVGRVWTQSSTHVYVSDVKLLPLSHPCMHRGRVQCSLAASWEHHGDCSLELACSIQAPAELEWRLRARIEGSRWGWRVWAGIIAPEAANSSFQQRPPGHSPCIAALPQLCPLMHIPGTAGARPPA